MGGFQSTEKTEVASFKIKFRIIIAVNRGARDKCRHSFFLQKKTVGH